MKGYQFITVLVAVLGIILASSLSAQPDKIVFDPLKLFGKSKRPGVTLSHNRHVEAGLSCKDCHHVYENGQNVLDEGQLEEGNQGVRCSACHGPKVRIGLEQAFHDQCIGCHTRLLKEKKKTGPRFCGQCHVKK
ncbi:MAG: cytochrome c3 family protein [Syntrophaceae bacterium]|nr:cytochrome c3 family protein [Syntrophaceae bacterium]